MKRALLFAGGWEGHQPQVFARLLAGHLRTAGVETVVEDSLACLDDAARLQTYDLLIPCWTMGQLSPEQTAALVGAVRNGTGLGGIHGGMGDAFRGNLDYEWMCGGHFAAHPHVGEYSVRIMPPAHPVTRGLPAEFTYQSEQYYLLVDPGVDVLAETDYRSEDRVVRMPVAWTKSWGRGRVFYSALGHDPAEFTRHPAALALTLQGLRWAAGLL